MDWEAWNREQAKRIAGYERAVLEVYKRAISSVSAMYASFPDIDPDKPFSFDDYPEVRERARKVFRKMHDDIDKVIINGVEAQWTLANNRNNELSNIVFGGLELSSSMRRRYYADNSAALETFKKRKSAGLGISDRVWKYTRQYKSEIEAALWVGIGNGVSAQEMSRMLRDYLQYPDKLFRRVRDEFGELRLSKAAKEFNPGRGVYRSSYKNARRLAATETNMAYRTADFLRWQQMDYVVGIEIRLSNNHTLNGRPFKDICDELAGFYPKSFKFTGWHPLCRCYQVPVLKTDKELAEDARRVADGNEPLNWENSVNAVKEVSREFKEWISNNAERIVRASSHGTLPYFILDNNKTSITEYAQYKSNSSYKNVEINGKTWGVKATHKGHNFDNHKGWYETSAQNAGYNAGHRVILENEQQDIFQQRSCDGLWDGRSFEIAGAETATPSNIRNALKHCASKPGCEIAIVFFPKYYSNALFEAGLGKYLGLKGTSQYREFKMIVCIHDGLIVKEISQAE